jgi:GNAT superfamily N-acetyltransferase
VYANESRKLNAAIAWPETRSEGPIAGDPTMNDLLPPGGLVRKLWPGEAEAYRDHLLRLDAESRHRRFSGAVGDDFVAQHARSIGEFGTVVYGFFLDGTLRGAAELRPAAPFARDAEAAFSVEQPWQSHGVGTVLLEHVLLAARNRGITALAMQCLADNRRMQQLARKFAAEFKFDFGSVVGEVDPPRFTALSLAREWTEDMWGVFNAMLDAQARLVRAE